MSTANAYIKFINEVKQNIIYSRYMAMKLANKEQLKLYLKIGRMLAQKIDEENGELMSLIKHHKIYITQLNLSKK